MKRLFLDANVLLTAAHNPNGKAAFMIGLGHKADLQFAISPYALGALETITKPIHLVRDHSDLACPGLSG